MSAIRITLVCLLFSFSAMAVDLDQIQKELTSTGAMGWIHGSVDGLYVFTYRNPANFFDFVEMSLVSTTPEIEKQLENMIRHDQVLLKGKYMDNPSPQKHILVSSVQMVKKYQSSYPEGQHTYDPSVPGEILSKKKGTFLVHAVAGDGAVLVLEYKDAIVPAFVKNNNLTRDLYRGDLVELAYKIQALPDQPVHLNLDDTASQPVRVIESIKTLNGKAATLEGALILFPQSPEIKFNVFAVQQNLQDGLSRQFTLVNFDSPKIFNQIRAKLQAAWDLHAKDYVNGRNKLVSTKIQVRATGTLNEIDPSQANPQILLKDADALTIIIH